MLQFLELSLHIWLSPAVLFFILGTLIGLVGSHLEVPSGFGKLLSTYLVFSIGFQGGAKIVQSQVGGVLIAAALSGIIISFLTPFWGTWLARKMTSLRSIDAIGLSAHFGSTSLVTFIAATNMLKFQSLDYEPFMVGVLAVMETPAIFSALYLASRHTEVSSDSAQWRTLVFNGGVMLLLGSLVVGAITGSEGLSKLSGFLVLPFDGVLCLFLLEMGTQVGGQAKRVVGEGIRLAPYVITMALTLGFVGLGLGHLLGLSVGGMTLMAVLCGSASYIVVPAVLRVTLPDCNVPLCVSMALGLVFPFNVFIGIPTYILIARHLA